MLSDRLSFDILSSFVVEFHQPAPSCVYLSCHHGEPQSVALPHDRANRYSSPPKPSAHSRVNWPLSQTHHPKAFASRSPMKQISWATAESSGSFKDQRGRRMKGVISEFGSSLERGISRIRRRSVSQRSPEPLIDQ